MDAPCGCHFRHRAYGYSYGASERRWYGEMNLQTENKLDIAVLSDIHGNYVALESCLSHAFSHKISTFLFLGDYVGELAWPERTMQLLYEVNRTCSCWFIRGNKEEYWFQYRAGGEQGWEDASSTTGALLYAYRSLTPEDMDFFDKMSISQKIQPEGFPAFTACHGSPFKVNEKMLPEDENTRQIMERTGTPLILFGHTHVQRKIEHQGRNALNPGSVGIPLYSNGLAQYMILHGENGGWREEFVSLPYDTDRVIREMYEADMYRHAPYWSRITEKILQDGRVSHGTVLARVMELCTEETGSCSWPDIPEKYWEQAIGELL